MNVKGNFNGTSTFNRCRPLLEKKHVPIQCISFGSRTSGTISTNGDNQQIISKRKEYLTLRVLEGHRTFGDESRGFERAIRLEISNEYKTQKQKCDQKKNFSPPQNPRKIDCSSSMFNTVMLSPFMKMPVQSSKPCSDGDNNNRLENEDYIFDEMVQMDSNPIQLYELEVGESDFALLQQDQALLVDFANFSKSFIDLLSLCNLGNDDVEKSRNDENISEGKDDNECMHRCNPLVGCQLSLSGGMIGQSKQSSTIQCHGGSVSMYTCRIEEFSSNGGNKWNTKNGHDSENVVRFSIVESNQFRELTHISLNLLRGTDTAIKSYLSIRLAETLGSIATLKYRLQIENNRVVSAETSHNEMTKRFNELLSMTEKEKNALVHEADETIQKQKARKDEEFQALKTRSESEIEALRMSFSESEQQLQMQIEKLTIMNDKLKQEKLESNEDNTHLKARLSEHVEESKRLSSDLKRANDCLEEGECERKQMDLKMQQAQERIISLQQANDESTVQLRKAEEKLQKSSKEIQESNLASESYALRLHTTEQELNATKDEFSKIKDMLYRYQCDRQEMKRRMKSKVDLIQKQEEILSSNEMNSFEVNQRLEQAQKDLTKMQDELTNVKKELDDANKVIDENKKTIENNQQVRFSFSYICSHRYEYGDY